MCILNLKTLLYRIVELHLSHNRDLFHPMAVAMEIDKSGNSQQHPINAHQYYAGRISNDATSRVTLHLSSTGILTASISTGNDVIYIEVILHVFINTLFTHVYL